MKKSNLHFVNILIYLFFNSFIANLQFAVCKLANLLIQNLLMLSLNSVHRRKILLNRNLTLENVESLECLVHILQLVLH